MSAADGSGSMVGSRTSARIAPGAAHYVINRANEDQAPGEN
jgi:hypothetical protein